MGCFTWENNTYLWTFAPGKTRSLGSVFANRLKRSWPSLSIDRVPTEDLELTTECILCRLQMSQRMTKPTKWHVSPAKTQISLGIRPVWSESSLSAWRKLTSLATHWVHSEDSDQTGRMPSLIWVFAGHTCHFAQMVQNQIIQASGNSAQTGRVLATFHHSLCYITVDGISSGMRGSCDVVQICLMLIDFSVYLTFQTESQMQSK